MNFNNFTIKGRDTVNQAAHIAASLGQQAIETGHLLKAVKEEADDLVRFLFNKLGVNNTDINAALNKIVESYPKVSGGQSYLSNSANNAIQSAVKYASEMGDQYVSNILLWDCLMPATLFHRY